ncbi:MAG: WD40/YVTN/BNR-like repeat-containing protein [Anaerolineae bacterium]
MTYRRLRFLFTFAVLALVALASTRSARAGFGIWTPIGPEGGLVPTLAIDPNDSSVLYAGTRAIGVYKTTDSAATWQIIGSAMLPASDDELIVAADAQSTIYVSSFGDVYKSTDQGMTWTDITGSLPSATIRAMASNPLTPTEIFVGKAGGDGLFRSANAGSTWTQVLTHTGTADAIAFNPITPTTVYVGVYGAGVYRTRDSGQTWISSTTGMTNTDVQALAVNPVTPTILYAGISRGGIFKSTDEGTTWTAANNGDLSEHHSVYDLAVDPSRPQTVYAASLGTVLKTMDGGDSWVDMGQGLTGSAIWRLVMDPAQPNRLYATSEGGGVFVTHDAGNTWNAVNNGLTAHHVETLLMDSDIPSTLYAGTREYGVFKSTNRGTTWNALPISSTVHTLVEAPATPNKIIYAGTRSGVSRSTDGGASWQDRSNGLTTRNVLDLAVKPGAPDTLYAATFGGGVFTTTNGGSSWLTATTGITDSYVRAVAVHPVTPTIVFAGTDSGAFKSTDGGSSWTFTGPTGFYNDVEALAFDPVNPRIVYAAANILYWSDDLGATWQEVERGFNPTDLAISAAIPDRLYVASTSDVIEVQDPRGVQTTTVLAAGLLTDNVYAVAIDPTVGIGQGRVYAGTDSGSVHAYDIRWPWNLFLPLVVRNAP